MSELSPQLRLLRDFYYKKALKLPAEGGVAHARELIDKPAFFTLEHLQRHLNNPLLTPGWFSLIWQGQPVDCTPAMGSKSVQKGELSFLKESIIEEYLSRGAALLLRGIEFFEPAINAMCGAIDAPPDHVMASAIASFSQRGNETQSLRANTYDTLMIHLGGQMMWRIYARPEPGYPTPEMTPRHVGKQQAEIVMNHGDALYLKNGIPHIAETTGKYALHMSFEIYDQNLNAATALNLLTQEFNLDSTRAYSPAKGVVEKLLQRAQTSAYWQRVHELQVKQAENCRRGRAVIGNNRVTHLAGLIALERKASA